MAFSFPAILFLPIGVYDDVCQFRDRLTIKSLKSIIESIALLLSVVL